METVHIIAVLALLQYFYFGARVGKARGQYGIKAPAISGHEVFERHYRVHQNTLEVLALFLPALYLFAHTVSATWATALGGVYLLGRIIYARSYLREPSSRGPGFGLSVLPALVLLLGTLVAAIMALL